MVGRIKETETGVNVEHWDFSLFRRILARSLCKLNIGSCTRYFRL
jgi:hypothetical protein